MKKYGPIDARQSPRFCGVASFMRLPHITTTEDVDVAFIGIPFDTATTHRVGSRFAPAEIRGISRLLRPYNPAQEIDIFEYCSAIDYGDADVVPGYIEKTYEKIVETMQLIFDAGVIPIAMGGDHSITLGELRAAAAKYGKIALVQFDSHCDVWQEYFGEKYNHGTPFYHAVTEGLVAVENSIQLGIRGSLYSPDDTGAARTLGIDVVTAREIFKMNTPEIIRRIQDRVGERPAFLSFDIDFVDPAFAPGTGTPEVGGATSGQALEIVRGLTGLDFVGFDLVEVIPQYDSGQITSLLAANLMYEFLSLVARGKRGQQ